MIKLTIELIPEKNGYLNLRSILPKNNWDKLRKDCYKKANYCCEICGEKGKNHPVECHEIWEYNDENKVQSLAGLIALCPNCHEVKHYGRARLCGREAHVIARLVVINNWTLEETVNYINKEFEIYRDRTKYKWKIDLSWLENRGINNENVDD